MTNVVSLSGHSVPEIGEPQEGLIKLFEDLLARARSGELQSFIGTGFVADGQRLAVWCDQHPDVYQMLGSLAWLQHEYADRHTA